MRDFCHVYNQGQSHRKQNYIELTHISFEISYMDWLKIWSYLHEMFMIFQINGD
jgi:hypothetical protein